jgi:hypothetical protein
VFADRGEGVIELPAGRYRVHASRGGEYEVVTREVTLEGGAEVALEGVLARSVDSRGWMTSDTHIHSQLSPDSPDLFPDKVRALAAENVELPVSTEHEAIGDFDPHIRALGLGDWLRGIVGSEITTVNYGHFNAFPLVADPELPGNGRIPWSRTRPADTFAAIRRNAGEPFIQVNHPRGRSIGAYFSWLGLDPDTFITRVEDPSFDFDGIEVMNGCGTGDLDRDTFRDWFGFLNRGIRKVGTASSDNHRSARDDLGFPVTYVRMPVDAPAEAKVADARRAFFEGRLVLSCGPFLEVKARAGDAVFEVGDVVRTDRGPVTLEAAVQAPTWMDVDTLEVVVNGRVAHRQAIEGAEVVRFSGPVAVELPVGRDAWVAVAVRGDRRHGLWGRGAPSFALTNPIFLDGDGDGAWTMR